MNDWLNIANKIYIVTGGSSGIGKAVIEELLACGAKVANFDINEGNLTDENLFYVKTDVCSEENINNSVKIVVEKWGTVDGLVNNAGINIPAVLVDTKNPNSKYEISAELLDKIYAINQKGFVLCAKAVARILVAKKSGVIVNMGSESGLEGSQGQSIYAATKAAVYSFTRSWAKELGNLGVRVIGIAPGILEETGLRTLAYEEALAYTRNITVEKLRQGYSSTSTTPMGRSGKLSEVANAVVFALSERASYITGVTYNIAGGKTRG